MERITTHLAVPGRAAALAVLAGAAALAPPAAAQSEFVAELDRILTEEARRNDLGNAFQSLTIFGATPGITAAVFNVEEDGETLDLSSYKVSPSHSFEPVFGVRPYVEATLGYLNTDQTVGFDIIPDAPTRAKIDVDTFTALGGAGVEIDLFAGTVARPIVLIGYSRTTSDARIRGPFAEEIDAAGRGVLFDVSINSLLVGGALELAHDSTLDGDIGLAATVRYNHLFDSVLSASDPVLESDGDFGVFTGGIEVDGPLEGATLFGRELRWIGFASSTWLPGEQSDALGFAYFFELGAGLELVDRTVIGGVEGLSLRGSFIVGENVTGWSAGFAIEF